MGNSISTPLDTDVESQSDASAHGRVAVDLDLDDPGKWAIALHLDGILREVTTTHQETNNPEDQRTFCISFAVMQRIHLRKLQVELVKHGVHMHHVEEEPNNWEGVLERYIQALKDYDYMMDYSKRTHDYFLANGMRQTDKYIIKNAIKQYGTIDELREPKSMAPIDEPWIDDETPIGGTRGENTKSNRRKATIDCSVLAAIGAFFMLGPMWLMVLHPTKYTGLITTTVCVSVFGLLASWWLDHPDVVLSATAAYAAVLVVFVGVTTGS